MYLYKKTIENYQHYNFKPINSPLNNSSSYPQIDFLFLCHPVKFNVSIDCAHFHQACFYAPLKVFTRISKEIFILNRFKACIFELPLRGIILTLLCSPFKQTAIHVAPFILSLPCSLPDFSMTLFYFRFLRLCVQVTVKVCLEASINFQFPYFVMFSLFFPLMRKTPML